MPLLHEVVHQQETSFEILDHDGTVGVIGLAVYDEDEAQARLARLVESQKRGAADPFAVPAR